MKCFAKPAIFYLLFGISSFLFFIYMLFPTYPIKERIIFEAQKFGMLTKIGKVKKLYPLGLSFRDVELNFRDVPIKFEELSLKLSPLSPRTFILDSKLFGGDARFKMSFLGSRRFKILGKGQDIEICNILKGFSGKLSLNCDMTTQGDLPYDGNFSIFLFSFSIPQRKLLNLIKEDLNFSSVKIVGQLKNFVANSHLEAFGKKLSLSGNVILRLNGDDIEKSFCEASFMLKVKDKEMEKVVSLFCEKVGKNLYKFNFRGNVEKIKYFI